jgi:hypothetical protein
MPDIHRLASAAVVAVLMALTVRVGAGGAIQQPASVAAPVYRFHHVHLNSVDQ